MNHVLGDNQTFTISQNAWIAIQILGGIFIVLFLLLVCIAVVLPSKTNLLLIIACAMIPFLAIVLNFTLIVNQSSFSLFKEMPQSCIQIENMKIDLKTLTLELNSIQIKPYSGVVHKTNSYTCYEGCIDPYLYLTLSDENFTYVFITGNNHFYAVKIQNKLLCEVFTYSSNTANYYSSDGQILHSIPIPINQMSYFTPNYAITTDLNDISIEKRSIIE